MTLSSQQRMLGGLYGSLVGDALGVPVEFGSRDHRKNDPVVSMRGFGMHNQPAGTWSDDGSLLLCAVESLADHDFDTQDMGQRFVRWLDDCHWSAHGRVFDIGSATHRALDQIALGTLAEESGGRSESSNGNGSLMRILPVPLASLSCDLDDFCDRIARASAIPHAHDRTKLACVMQGLIVRALMGGENPSGAHSKASVEFRARYGSHAEYAHFSPLLNPDFATLPESAIHSSGYVLHTLTASIWCLLTTNSFSECVLKAVNLGDDTDTTGCVAGGLAGVLYGIESIPEEWLRALPRQEQLRNLFEKFVLTSTPRFTNPMYKLQTLQADITTLDVDAIVNAANSSLLGGGGVDGAIHRAAGPELLAECRMLNGCRTGEAKITKGYRLKARHVIHTVGPVWNGGKNREVEKLRACYTNSLRLAAEKELQSIAFPCISTGVYRFPPELAAQIAVESVRVFLETPCSIQSVIFCCFSAADRAHYECLLAP